MEAGLLHTILYLLNSVTSKKYFKRVYNNYEIFVQRCLAADVTITRDKIIKHVEVLNQNISDMNYLNKVLLDTIIAGLSKQDFLRVFSLTDKTFPD